jgi:hypothetical protein
VSNNLEVTDVFDEIDVLEGTDADDASCAIDVSDFLDESDIFTVTDILDITDIVETTNIDSVIDITKVSDVKIVVVDVPNVLNLTDITDVVKICDALNDLSSMLDISQVTATREVLKVHQVDKEHDANGSPVPSSGITPCPRRPPKKPPYSKQYGNTNLHDTSPYEFLQAHVHEMEPVVVSDDDITDDLDHSDDDIYDPSYEMDPFGISSSVDTIQAHVSKSIPRPVINEKACANQDKWSNMSHKPKDLWEQIDDKNKSVKLEYTKSPSCHLVLPHSPVNLLESHLSPLDRVVISTFMR